MLITNYFKLLLTLLFGAALFIISINVSAYPDMKPAPEKAQEEVSEEKPVKGKSPKSKKKDFETIEEFLEDGEYENIDGFLNIYKETEKNKYYMVLTKDDLEKEFLYFAYVLNAPPGSGVMSGEMIGDSQIGNGVILEFRKFNNKIGLYKKNTYFSNDTDNNIAKRDMTMIFEAFISTFDLVVDEKDKYLISADKIFLTEMLTSISPNIPPEYRDFYSVNLGKMVPSKTYIEKINNYDKNTNVEVNFGFYNPKPNQRNQVFAVADPRYTSVSFSHLFVEMPDDNFKPRLSDQRVGFYSAKITDLSSYDRYPSRDVINKWRLEKKFPDQEISEPVKPITFWVEKSTPDEIKPFVVKGIEGWNVAFEKAGFKNAVVAKIQPDDAEWDAGDVEYNVVRWSHSPARSGLAGFGPSIANPRTGEIIASDIRLEFGSIKTGYLYRELWGYDEENDPLEQWIVNLTMHEVGHTLALIHNFIASYQYGPNEIHDVSVTGGSTTSSVMDYDPINIAPPGIKQGKYFSVAPGDYDIWAIEFGYKPELEGEEREKHLAKSIEQKYLWHWEDIDPRFATWDLSNDPIAYAKGRFEVVDKKISELGEIFNEQGETKNDFTNAFYRLTNQKQRFMAAVTRLIGGVYVARIVNGQDDVNAYEPVEYSKQKEAMSFLIDNFLANDAWSFDPEIVKNLQREKRVTEFPNSKDPQLHDLVLNAQGSALSRILSPTVMTRLVNSSEYGNEYMPDEVLSDLFNGIFVAREVPTTYKMNLQSKYVDTLIGALENKDYDEISKAAIYSSLVKMEKFTKLAYGDETIKNHFSFLNWKLSKALED